MRVKMQTNMTEKGTYTNQYFLCISNFILQRNHELIPHNYTFLQCKFKF